MNYRQLLSGALCAGILLGGPNSVAQEKNPGQDQINEMMQKWKEISTPGEPHKKLDVLVGSWDVEIKVWMGGPDAAPALSKGSCTYTKAVGGRFIRQDFAAETAGMPIEGVGYTGYDNFQKKYVGVWLDNSTTAIFTLEGTMNREGTVLTMYGKMDEWMTGEVGKMSKYVWRILNKDKFIFEIHDLAIGEPNTRTVEFTYTRKK